MYHDQRLILATLLLSLSAAFISAQEKEDSGVELKAREPWTTVFGGERVKLHFDFNAVDPDRYTARWSYAAGQRRLAAGELTVKAGPDGTGAIEVPLRIPAVRDGVIFETELTVSLVKQSETVTTLSKPITIYPSDPLIQKQSWIEELSISLYDPDGKTADQFKAAGIPFERVGTLASIGNVEEGFLVIGEGLSLKVQRGMFDVLAETASREIPVLWLASTEGAFPLPFAAEEDLPQPDRVLMDRAAVIKRFDKRFDDQAWGTQGNPAVNSLQIVRSRTGIEMEVTESSSGWSWLEMHYGESGVLVWCGLGIIERWEESPTPRYLLVRIFEDLTETTQSQSVSDDKPRSLP